MSRAVPAVASGRLAVRLAWRMVVGRGSARRRMIASFALLSAVMLLALYVVDSLNVSPGVEVTHAMGSAPGTIYADSFSDGSPSSVVKPGDGVRALPFEVQRGHTVVQHGVEVEYQTWTADWRSPVSRSQWNLRAGRWPRGAREVAVPTGFDAAVGTTLRFAGTPAPVRVVGVVRDDADFADRSILGAPAFQHYLDIHPNKATVPPLPTFGYLLVGSPRHVAAVIRRAGLRAHVGDTRAEVLHRTRSSLFRQQLWTVTVPGMIVVFLVALVAVSVRFRKVAREFAYVHALGLSRSVIVWTFRAGALMATAVGCAVGCGVAALAAALLHGPLSSGTGHVIPAATVSLSAIGLCVGVIAACALVASWLPARVAIRSARGFAGEGSPLALPRPVLGAGAAVFVAALGFSLAASGPTAHLAAVAVAAAAFPVVGCALFALAASAGSRAGFAPGAAARQVLRDVKRPVLAASVGAVLLAAGVASLTYDHSLQVFDRASVQSDSQVGTAEIPLDRTGPSSALLRDLRAAAGPGARIARISVASPQARPPATGRLDVPADYAVPVGGGSGGGTLGVIASRTDFAASVGRAPTAAEWAALRSGGMLQLVSGVQKETGTTIDTGSGPFRVQADRPSPPNAKAQTHVVRQGNKLTIDYGSTAPPKRLGPTFEVDAVDTSPVPNPGRWVAPFLVGPRFLAVHGLNSVATHLDVWRPGRVDPGLGQRVDRVVEGYGISASEVIFDAGLLPPLPFNVDLVLVALLVLAAVAVGVSVFISSLDARGFLQTLYVLGVAPARQRRIAAFQALLIGLAAAAGGVLLGLGVGGVAVAEFGATPSLGGSQGRVALVCVACLVAAFVFGLLCRTERRNDELLA